ncbi:hypothetical protein [Microbacterium allomyrinae]|uniref:Uncharacterized protein n=1 Tax=Microbacterium allomyrinae TaxID=2830666 RepID=A0A9X1S1I0_9MICO|nr:hypothetical protein [Microbacterium allomyrinae]MCC2031706.1 hypothetical protein [Microbacterium allomyrinae]
MRPTVPTESVNLGPLQPNWTVRDLLSWIAEDDTRCHEPALTPLVAALDRALRPERRPADGSVTMSSPVGLVRSLASLVRSQPALGRTSVLSLLQGGGQVAGRSLPDAVASGVQDPRDLDRRASDAASAPARALIRA